MKPLYNGNIVETYWRSASDNVLRKYGYGFDSMNRLEQAIYQRPDNVDTTPDSYNEIISYDKNGNILQLWRTCSLDSADMALVIDDLSYYYPNHSNRLMKVTDYENSAQGFSDDSDGTDDTADDYDYDAYGNLVMDQNKNIEKISYNHLNLPVKIWFSNSGINRIDYIYNALGQKVRKTVTMDGDTGPVETTTDYLGGFQYADSELMSFPTAEGYVRVVKESYNYVYNYKDHLGNIRLSYTDDPEEPGKLVIIEENHYYPYGLKHQNYNIEKWEYEEVDDELVLASASALQYKYKFNGMEFQEELGLNLYDMDFRDYDPAIARWIGIDPVTHHNMSTYMAFDGNPVYWADPSGADSVDGIVFSGDAAASVYQSIISAMDHFGDNSWSIGGMDVSGEEHENIAGFTLDNSGGGGGIPGPGDVLSNTSFKFKSISNYRYARITGVYFTIINGSTSEIFENIFSLEIGVPIKGKDGKIYSLSQAVEYCTMVLNAVATQYAAVEAILANPAVQKMTLSSTTLPYIFSTIANLKLNNYMPGSSVTANTYRYNVTESPAIYVNWLSGLLQRLWD